MPAFHRRPFETLTASVATATSSTTRADLGPMPEWNLGDLYPGLKSPEVARDLDAVAVEARRIKDTYQGKLVAMGRDGVALAAALWELVAQGKAHNARRVREIAWLVAVIALVAQVLVHHQMTALLDVPHREVLDEIRFYQWHRLYLCLATAQWLGSSLLLVSVSSSPCPTCPPPPDPAG